MKVFVINLDKDKDRMASIDTQLRSLGVEYERVPGVYAKEMPEEERNRVVNHFRWWCAIGRPIVPAEIGCALSHRHIYERMIREDIPWACILEDDVIIANEFPIQLQELDCWITATKPLVIMLSNHTKINFNKVQGGGYKSKFGTILLTNQGMCTDGYCITKIAAENIIRQNFPMIVPCDHWGRWIGNGVIKLYHFSPSSVKQDQETFISNQVPYLAVDKKSNVEHPRLSFLKQKSKRCIGVAIDKLLRIVTGR